MRGLGQKLYREKADFPNVEADIEIVGRWGSWIYQVPK